MIGRRSHDDAQAFEDALNGRASSDQAIAGLVRFAEDLCEAAVVEPSATFGADLRTRLMTEATTVLVPMPAASRPVAASPRPSRKGRRRVAGLTAALIASAGAVSLVSSSASALPGDLLYPVKRTVESVEMTLHRSDSDRGAFQLAQASERLVEARKLSEGNASPTLINEALDSFSESAASGSTRLFSDFTSSGQEKSVRKVNDFATAASADLTALSGQLPDDATVALATATDTISKLATEATTLCVSCVSSDLQSLVNSVTDLAKKPARTPSSDADKKAAADKPASGQGSPPTAPTPTKAPATSAPPTSAPSTPAPAATTKTPSLTDITDPLLGGLLGDDEQEGLVPGLLNGLLGGKK